MNELTALSIRRRLQRPRARIAALGCVLALAGAVSMHHSPMPGNGMDMPGMGMIVCLAVIGAAAAVAAVCGVLWRVRCLPRIARPTTAAPRYAVRAPAARAGPPLFLRLASLRR